MKKIILLLNIILIISLFVGISKVYAEETGDGGVTTIIGLMKDTAGQMDIGNGGIKDSINNVIGLIQVAGTGISVIVVTMLGIKYLLASPSEKADVKKQITPILIGCVLLFGAVNLVAIIADFSGVLNT